MRRTMVLLLALCLTAALVSCGGKETVSSGGSGDGLSSQVVSGGESSSEAAESTGSPIPSDSSSSPVSSKAPSPSSKAATSKPADTSSEPAVTVVLPAELVSEISDLDAEIAGAKAAGVADAVKNADGSLSYTMPKSVRSTIRANAKKKLDSAIASDKSQGAYPSIQSVTYNGAISEMIFMVDRAAYENGSDATAAFPYFVLAAYYQVFNGVPGDAIAVTFHIKDQATGEVLDTIVYPDALEY